MLVKVSCWPPFLNFENSCETNNSISGYPNVIHAGGKYCFLSVQRKKLTKEEINHNYITKGVKLFAFLRYYDRQTDQPINRPTGGYEGSEESYRKIHKMCSDNRFSSRDFYLLI